MDNLLTRLIGGVAAESFPYPPESGDPLRHPLERPPVTKITSVYGLRNGSSYAFVEGEDFVLEGESSLVWTAAGALPDEGSTFQVNYFSGATTSAITDIHVGSVARTLMEASALEMAGLYAQMQLVYDSGFIDTAQGSALDNVVALLGLERARAGHNQTTLEFTRLAGSAGEITLPAGTRVLSGDANFEYETIASVTMIDGQSSIKVSARDILPANEPVAAGSLTIIAKPIAGISGVTNTDASTLSEQDETDTTLRTRAKNFLHNSERATKAAIENVLTRQQVLADVDDESTPGLISITYHEGSLSPERQLELEAAIRAVKPAGVAVDHIYAGSPQAVDLDMRVTTSSDLLETDLRAIQDQIRSAVTDYFGNLPVKSDASVNKIVGLVLADPRVDDVRILAGTANGSDILNRDTGLLELAGTPSQLGLLTITDPNLPTRVNVTVSYPINLDSPDKTSIETALSEDISYLNSSNAVETGASPSAEDIARQTLSFGKLALALPLPDSTRTALASQLETDVLPLAADLAPYALQWSLISETGEVRLISSEADADYRLADFERLSLAQVDVIATSAIEEPADG
jgi:uncharacterized phage protein gp47/JayE